MRGPRLFTYDVRVKKYEDRDARVEHVEQKLAMYCGAACATMIAGRYGVALNQADAYTKIHDEQRFATERLYSDPTGMSALLQNMLPQAAVADANVVVADALDPLLGAIVHSLAFAEFPPALLAQRGNHWVVCDGVRLLVDPSGASECIGLFFENPWFNQTAYSFHPIEEVRERWLLPNQWGVTWLNKFVIVGALPDAAIKVTARVLSLITRTTLTATGVSDATAAAVALTSLHGFQSAIIAGGGFEVTEPVQVKAEDGSGDFIVVPLDATADKTFRDFIYVAISAASDRLYEITHFETRLQIPDDGEALAWTQNAFPSAQLSLDPNYLWQNDFRCMSRFSVYRKVLVDGVAYRVFASGEIVADAAKGATAGG